MDLVGATPANNMAVRAKAIRSSTRAQNGPRTPILTRAMAGCCRYPRSKLQIVMARSSLFSWTQISTPSPTQTNSNQNSNSCGTATKVKASEITSIVQMTALIWLEVSVVAMQSMVRRRMQVRDHPGEVYPKWAVATRVASWQLRRTLSSKMLTLMVQIARRNNNNHFNNNCSRRKHQAVWCKRKGNQPPTRSWTQKLVLVNSITRWCSAVATLAIQLASSSRISNINCRRITRSSRLPCSYKSAKPLTTTWTWWTWWIRISSATGRHKIW